MNVERAILAKLEGAPAVVALVGTRIYHGQLPERPTWPCVQFVRVDTTQGDRTLEDRTRKDHRFQVDCWGADIDGALALGEAVHGNDDRSNKGPLDGFAGVVVVGLESLSIQLIEQLVVRGPRAEDDLEPGAVVRRVGADYRVHL
jgi:hypothetical protein